jgi:hypothetical protein
MSGRVTIRNSNGGTEAPVPQDEASRHLNKVLQSTVFNASETLRQLLVFLAKSTAEDPTKHPKEHEIATAVLGRDTEFDPRVDSVVRVQIGRLRSKLAEYYVSEGSKDEVILQIPKGEYQLRYHHRDSGEGPALKHGAADPVSPNRPTWWLLLFLGLGIAFLLVIYGTTGLFFQKSMTTSQLAQHVLPWSVLLQKDRRLHLILSDPDIATTQALFSYRITLSDYANKRYLPDPFPPNPLMPDPNRFFRGVNVSSVAYAAAMSFSELTIPFAKPLVSHLSRAVQLRDLKTDDDFIFIGSPRSNPWSELFADQLDFYFVREDPAAPEVIHNRRPQSGELERYVASAAGWETGQGFAILAFSGNPGQHGYVLLVAGTNAEGTETAAKLAANPDLLSSVLAKYGIDPHGPLCYFEVLLNVRTMAGSPHQFEVIACHRLEK